jgi:hypothetical protein
MHLVLHVYLGGSHGVSSFVRVTACCASRDTYLTIAPLLKAGYALFLQRTLALVLSNMVIPNFSSSVKVTLYSLS